MNVYSSGMEKRILALLFMLSFVFQSSLAAERITTKNWPKFAGIEFGSSAEAVKKALEEKGYKCEKPDEVRKGKAYLRFTGMLAGKKASGYGVFELNKLKRVGIIYGKDEIDFDEVTFAAKLAKILANKYGNFFKTELNGSAVLAWRNADNSDQVALTLTLIPGDKVRVNYWSFGFSKKVEKKIEEDIESEKDF